VLAQFREPVTMPSAMKTKRIGRSTMEIQQGDITALAVDAIVNAANRYLAHGGGVALAILRNGGAQIQAQSAAHVARHGPLDTGAAAITTGGNLPARHVIHAVGPVWKEHPPDEADRLLRDAIRNSLALADRHNFKSIAFPAISTGIYGFPVERAAPLMLQEAANHLAGNTKIERVIFCLFDDNTCRAFERAFETIR
jgi:O-acetyl-ADP-ribose deacetylase (regulator of RNase III)